MATIDYKQKIKDYMNSSEVDTLYKSMLNNLFPELAESEDEGIRKELISLFQDCIDRIKHPYYESDSRRWIAWLEKQGEKEAKGNEREIPNYAWSGEDEDNMMMIENMLSDYLDYIREDTSLTKHQKNSMKEEVIGYDNWFKSLRERYTWKPSDEQMDALLYITKHYKPTATENFSWEALQTLELMLEQLKKLKEE